MTSNFTKIELQTLYNADFFLNKVSAAKKIEHLFSEVRDAIKGVVEKEKITFPKEVDSSNGKIFRGENYLGLPYLVLDYPKHFSKNSIFSFRTMFWWGNFFSFTFHLQGTALEEWRRKKAPLHFSASGRKESTQTSSRRESRNRLYICVNNNPWQYHYKKDNYLPIEKLSDSELRTLLLEKEFVKLSRKIPIKDYKKLSAFCKESFHQCLSVLERHR